MNEFELAVSTIKKYLGEPTRQVIPQEPSTHNIAVMFYNIGPTELLVYAILDLNGETQVHRFNSLKFLDANMLKDFGGNIPLEVH